MRRNRARWLIPLVVAGLVAPALLTRPAAAQVPETVAVSDDVWEIRLADGSTIIGQVTAATPERLTVRTLAGATVEIQRNVIRSMSASGGTVRDGRFWPADPNRTRLFFGPTGRMLDQGEGYISVFELFLPFASYGVSNYLTLAGGTPIIPEGIGRVWYFAPKAGGQIGERTSLSGGVLAFVDVGTDLSDDLDTFGILYGVATHGTDRNALTFGAGFGFAGEDVSSKPVFLLGGESRLSPRLTLLSENYFITYNDFDGQSETTGVAALLSLGLRFIGDRLSADAGLGFGLDSDEALCCLPLVNFVYNFGGAR